VPLMVTVWAPASASIVMFWAVRSKECGVKITSVVLLLGPPAPASPTEAGLWTVSAWSSERVTEQLPPESVTQEPALRLPWLLAVFATAALLAGPPATIGLEA